MDSIWKRIRQESNLPKHIIANKLGIDEQKYNEIEKGQRELPTQYIDKMMQIKYASRENKTEFKLETAKAEDFIAHADWKKLECEFNYPTIIDMCKAMNVSSSTYYYVKYQPELVASKTKVKIYNFFMDPLNKHLSNEKSKKTKFDKTSSVIKFNEDGSIDVDWLLDFFGVAQIKLCAMLGIDRTCVSKWKTKKQIPCSKTMEKLDKLIRDKLSGCPVIPINPDTTHEEITEIEDIIEDIETHKEEKAEAVYACDIHDDPIADEKDLKIQELTNEIINLKRTIMYYEKLIDRL